MPKINDVRTESGNGQLYSNPTDSSSTTVTSTSESGGTVTTGFQVLGKNLGIGEGVFAGSNNGPKLTTLDFRSIVAGSGLAITGDADTITITSTGTVSSDIGNLTGTLTVQHGGTGVNSFASNGILVGNGSGNLQTLPLPSGTGKVLTWNGTTYEWDLPVSSTNGTVTSVGIVAGSSKVSVSGGPITTTGVLHVDVNEGALTLNNLAGTLAITKGGTGATTLTSNALLIGNGTGPIQAAAIPSAAGQVLSWNGSTYSWATQTLGITGVTATGSNGVTATAVTSAGATSIAVSLAPTGINAGAYSYPTMQVDAYGRITSITSNSIDTVIGTSLGSGGQAIYAGMIGSNLSFKQLQASTGLVVSSDSTTVTVGLGTVPYANGGTGATSYTTGGLVVSGASSFSSTDAPPESQTSLLGSDGTNFGWYSIPGSSVVTSVDSSLAITPSLSGTVTTYDLSVQASALSINGLQGVLDVTKGGTGTTTLTQGGLLVGNGTGAVTAVSAPTAAGSVLSWDGSSISWSTQAAAPTPGGGVGAVQFNGSGFAGSSNLTWNNGASTLLVNGIVSAGVVQAGDGSASPTTGVFRIANSGDAGIAMRSNSSSLAYFDFVDGLARRTNIVYDFASTTLSFGKLINEAAQTAPLTFNFATGSAMTTRTNFTNPNEFITKAYVDAVPGYSLPTASDTVLGGVKVGPSLIIDEGGVLNAQNLGTVTSVALVAGSTKLHVTGSPITDNGTITVDVMEANLNIGNMTGTIQPSQVAGLQPIAVSGSYTDLSNTPTLSTVAHTGDYNDLLNLPSNGNLTAATTTTLGGVIVGGGLQIAVDGTLSVDASAGLGTVTSVDVQSVDNKITVTDGPITTTGTIHLILNEGNLTLANLAGNLPAARIDGLATVATTGAYSDLTGKPTLFSGSYTDLTNKPSLFSGAYVDLTGKPVLATVATSGAYADLTGKPTLFSGSYTDLSNTPTFATVATTGNYGDLSNLPSLFSGVYSDLTGKPTLFSGSYTDLSNKPSLFSGAYTDLTGKPVLATIATTGLYTDLIGAPAQFSGSYADLTNKPVLFSGNYSDLNGLPVLFSGSYSDLANVPTFATVATTGAYSDLSGKPVLAAVATSGSYVDLTNKPTFDSLAPSQTGFAGYVLSTDGTTTSWIPAPTGGSGGTGSGTVTSIAVTSANNRISVSGSPISSSGTIGITFNEANIDIGNTAGTIASTRVTGLSTIATTGSYTDLSGAPILATVATSGSYNDLANKPSIPTQYTDALARAAISVTGSLAYNSTTGVISYTAPTLATVATTGAYSDLTGTPAAYSLPTASATVLGGVKVGAGLSITGGVLAATNTNAGTVTSVNLTAGSSKVTVSGGPITSTGAITVDVAESVLNIANMTGSISTARVTGLATVATSGSYTDLTNKPSIPTQYTDALARAAISVTGSLAYDNSTGVISYTTPSLATVATTGAYADLTGKPTLFSGSYTDLTSKPSFATVATSGLYSDLSGTPVLATVALTGAYSDLTGKPTLSTVATTGAYSDLTGKPTLATVATTGSYNDLLNKPTTDGITEGTTNLYFTNARARSAISLTAGSSGATYNSTTGVLDLSAVTSGGGSSIPAASTAQAWYKFSVVMNAGTTMTNGTDPATVGLTGLPSGWSVSVVGGIATITHTVGRSPIAINFLVGTSSTSNPIYVFIPGGNTAATGVAGVPASGSTTPDTTRFKFQLVGSMGCIANGTVQVMVMF